MDTDKIKRIAQDLYTLTGMEAEAVIGHLNHNHGITFSATVVHVLQQAVARPSDCARWVDRTPLMLALGPNKIQVFKLLHKHLGLGYIEAKEFSARTPVRLGGEFRGRDLQLSDEAMSGLVTELETAGATVDSSALCWFTRLSETEPLSEIGPIIGPAMG